MQPNSFADADPHSYPISLECKCCGAMARLEGYVDFDRDCYGVNLKRAQVRGLPIPYYRCQQCDFTFTSYFDNWDSDAFVTNIYNEEYPIFDHRFEKERPQETAELVGKLCPDLRTRIMDYGSGNGYTAKLLREAGYAKVEEYDPFHGAAEKPEYGGFDLVICIEVAEHSPTPLALFAELDAFAGNSGIILLSTQDFSIVKGRWVDNWYVAPRNGHISFFSKRTLRLLAQSLNRHYLQLNPFKHLLMPRGTAQFDPTPEA